MTRVNKRLYTGLSILLVGIVGSIWSYFNFDHYWHMTAQYLFPPDYLQRRELFWYMMQFVGMLVAGFGGFIIGIRKEK